MKKIGVLFLGIVILVSIFACNNTSKVNTPSTFYFYFDEADSLTMHLTSKKGEGRIAVNTIQDNEYEDFNLYALRHPEYSLNIQGVRKVIIDTKLELDSTINMFANMQNLSIIEGIENINFKKVKSMRGMFKACESIKTIDTANWDVRNVTDMRELFNGCNSLEKINTSNWDVKNVVNMSNKFVLCESLKNVDVSNWNVGNVVNMEAMFSSCKSLKNIDIRDWNVSNVIDMNNMFNSCKSLENINVENWDVSKVTNMYSMFSECRKLESVNVEKWSVNNVKNMRYMFSHCQILKKINISNWNFNDFVDCYEMFSGCRLLENEKNNIEIVKNKKNISKNIVYKGEKYVKKFKTKNFIFNNTRCNYF